jgi:hypothetical protein
VSRDIRDKFNTRKAILASTKTHGQFVEMLLCYKDALRMQGVLAPFYGPEVRPKNIAIDIRRAVSSSGMMRSPSQKSFEIRSPSTKSIDLLRSPSSGRQSSAKQIGRRNTASPTVEGFPPNRFRGSFNDTYPSPDILEATNSFDDTHVFMDESYSVGRNYYGSMPGQSAMSPMSQSALSNSLSQSFSNTHSMGSPVMNSHLMGSPAMQSMSMSRSHSMHAMPLSHSMPREHPLSRDTMSSLSHSLTSSVISRDGASMSTGAMDYRDVAFKEACKESSLAFRESHDFKDSTMAFNDNQKDSGISLKFKDSSMAFAKDASKLNFKDTTMSFAKDNSMSFAKDISMNANRESSLSFSESIESLLRTDSQGFYPQIQMSQSRAHLSNMQMGSHMVGSPHSQAMHINSPAMSHMHVGSPSMSGMHIGSPSIAQGIHIGSPGVSQGLHIGSPSMSQMHAGSPSISQMHIGSPGIPFGGMHIGSPVNSFGYMNNFNQQSALAAGLKGQNSMGQSYTQGTTPSWSFAPQSRVSIQRGELDGNFEGKEQ